MEWITENNNPIRNIQTGEVKLSEKEIMTAIDTAFEYANRQDNPCVTVIRLSINKAIKEAYSKPIIGK